MTTAIDIPHRVNKGTRTSGLLNPSQPPLGHQSAPLNHAMTLSTCTVPIARTHLLPLTDCIMMWIEEGIIIHTPPPVGGIETAAGEGAEAPPVTTHPIVVDTHTQPQADMEYTRIDPGTGIMVVTLADMTVLVVAMLDIMTLLITVAYMRTICHIGTTKKVGPINYLIDTFLCHSSLRS